MKLELRRFPNPTQPSRECLLVTDENGVPLPGQRAVAIAQEVDKETIVTVELLVDGERFRLNVLEESEGTRT